ncbi:tandem-95 repeat protein [Candidatus Nitrospira nitrificans]|nr:tandem-95 repeat protein [Candidatus Nitrospira nitrificans]
MSQQKKKPKTASNGSEAPRPKLSFLSLESRLMFDAAASATAAEVNQEQVAQEQAESAVSAEGGREPTAAEDESQEVLQAIASYNPGETTIEVVFVDPTVPNYRELLSGMNPDMEVIMLDGGQDGVEQMTAALSGRTGIDAIHVISHGAAGTLQLGTGTLTTESMSGEYADELATIQQALSEQADILIYGCDFAEGEVGQAAVNRLAALTGADVQASNDFTGHMSLGGDWDFEVRTGAIEARIAIDVQTQANWVGLLAAPVLDASKSPTLSSIGEDAGAPSGAVGTQVSSLVDFASPSGQVDNVTDADSGAQLGIAITGANTSNGTWWYSTNNGSTWNALGSVSDAGARLLAADGNTRLYFQANANYTGTMSDAITLRAWDRTSGTNGGTANLSTTSTAIDQFNTVSYSNNNGTVNWSGPWQEIGESDGTGAGMVMVNSYAGLSGNSLQIETDFLSRGAGRSIDLSTASSATLSFDYIRQHGGGTNGVVSVEVYNGKTWTTLDTLRINATDSAAQSYKVDISAYANANTQIRFIVTGRDSMGRVHVDNIQVESTGVGGGATAYSSASDTASLTVTAVNDAPVLDNSGVMTLTSITEDATNNNGQTVASIIASAGGDRITDADAGASEGIAITSLTSGSGTWQYNTGSGWTNIGTVSESSALLLRATDSIRFVPNGERADSGSISFRAWDRTSGTAGSKVATGTTTTVTDQFNSASFGNNNGTQNWTGAWIETDAGGAGVASGSIQISSNQLRFDADRVGDNIAREVNLSGTTGSTLSFSYNNTLSGADRVEVRISSNGGANYTTLTNGTFSGSLQTGSGSASFDISAYASPNTRIQFIVTGVGGNARFYADNVQVTSTSVSATGAFSSAADTASITVTAVNDAPVLTPFGPTTTTTEGAPTVSGRVSDLLLSSMTDVDSGAVEGIALFGLGGAGGTLEYSLDGVTWSSVGSVSTGSALLLRATDYLRMTPDTDNGGTLQVDYRGWDQTAGTAGTKVDVSVTGGTTAFSIASDRAVTTITAVNDAPTITSLSGDSLAYSEGAGAVVIEQGGNALVADVDSTNLDTGTLTVSIPSGGDSAEDVLSIRNQGTGAGQIGVSGSTVTYGGVAIGTFTGGTGGSNLIITLNSSATPTAVTALVKNITYENTDTASPTTGARTIRYVLTDGDGGTSTNYDTTVTVTAVNDAPTDLSLSANTVAENSANGTVVGTVSGTDADTGDTKTYSFTDNAGGRFAINSSTGQITVADGSLLNYEAATSHGVTVRVTDAGGLTYDETFTIAVTNVNEAPVAADDRAGLRFDGVDDFVDMGSGATYEVTDTVTMEAWINREPSSQATQIIMNKEGEYEIGLDVDGSLKWAFANTNPGWAWHDTGVVIPVHTWTHIAVTYDHGTITSYVDGVAVEIFAGSGTIGDAHPTKDTLRIGGRENNPADQYFSGQISEAQVWNVARTAGEIAGDRNGNLSGTETGLLGYWKFNENSGTNADNLAGNSDGTLGGGTTGQTPQWSTYRVSEDNTLSIAGPGVLGNDHDVDGDALSAVIVTGPSHAGSFTLNSDGSFSYTPAADFSGTDSFTYRVSDGANFSNIATAYIQVDSANDAPTDLSLSANTVAENAANGTVVGTVSGTDVDTGDTKTYSLTDTAGGRFAINSSTGQITVANGSLLNYENAASHSVTVRVTDSGGLTYDETFTINLADMNEAPTGTDAAITIAEDSSYTLTTGNFGFSDVDAGDSLSAVRMDTIPTAGSLTLSGVAVTAGQVVSVVDLTAGNLVFTPSANATGAGYANLTFSVRDANNAYDAAPNTLTFNVTAVNDAPTRTAGTVSNLTVSEDAGLASLGLGGVAYSPGGGADESAQILTYAVTVVPSAGVGDVFLADGTTRVTVGSYTLADIQGMQFKPAANASGVTAFQFNVYDSGGTANGGANTISQFIQITLTAVNDAPTITNLSGDGLSYSEGAGAVVIEQGGNALVADVDSTNLDTGTLTVSIPAGGDSAEDVLSIRNQGTGAGQIGVSGSTVTYGGVAIGTFTGGTGGSNLIITLNSSATPTAVTALVKNITYENTDTAAPTTGARTVRYVLTDGDGGTSANYDTTVTVTAVNDAPTDLSLSANTVAENSANGTVVGTVSGTDVDTGDTKTYSFTDNAGGRFAINSSTGQITVADGSLLNYETATSHGITVRVTDSGGLTYDETFTINLTNVNEAPTGADAAITIIEDSSHTLTTANFGFSDVDAGDSLSAVRIDTLPGAGSLTLSGVVVTAGQVVSVADITAGNLVFTPVADATGTGYANLTFSVRDASNAYDAVPNTLTFDVTAVNDAPINTVPGAQTVNEDTALAISGVSVNDVDGNLSTVQLAVGNGTLAVTLSGGATISAGNNGTNSLTLSGNQADINTTLATLVYQGTPNFNGSDTLTVTSTDANSGSDVDTVAITVTAVNDPTVVTGGTSGMGDEDTTLTGTLTATDVEGLSDGTVFTVTTSATNGTASIDPATGLWSYTPTADFHGTDNFTVTITDDAGTSITQVISVTVTPVDDAPILSVNTSSTVTEGGTDTIDSSDLVVTDIEQTAAQLTYSIGTGPAYGRLELTTAPGVSALTFTQADIAANRLVYVHDGSETTSDSFTFTVSDGVGGTLGATTMTLTITPVNDTPTVTSGGGASTAAVNVAENVSAVTIVTGADVDLPAQTLTYGLSGGADQARFTINAVTGALSFTSPPDFEVATDVNGDNIYVVQIQVTDSQGASTIQTIQVTVMNVAEGAPPAPLPPPVLLPTTPTGSTGPGPISPSPAESPVQTTEVPTTFPVGSSPSASPPEFTPTGAMPSETERLNPIRSEEPRKTIDLAKDSVPFYWIDETGRLLLTGTPVEATPTPEFEPVEPSQSVSDLLFSKLDDMTASLEQAMDLSQEQHAIIVRIAALTGTTLSSGFIVWTLRSGTLLASCLATMPVWRHFDPLPVLGGSGSERERRRKEAERDRQAEATEFKGLKHVLDSPPDPKP